MGGNPLYWVDPFGLDVVTVEGPFGVPVPVVTPNGGYDWKQPLVTESDRNAVKGVVGSILCGKYHIMCNEDGNESSNDQEKPHCTPKVEEEYDSLEAAVGSVNPLDDVDYEGKTKNPGLIEQGFTEKWTGVDSNGTIQSAFKNPKTGKWTGGHRSSKNDKFW